MGNGHPPKPPLTLSLGIVGHRPNRLPEAARSKIAADLDTVIAAVADAMRRAGQAHSGAFAGDMVLTLVDSLAEGADRIAARACTARMGAAPNDVTFALDVVLPFARDEFAKDFAEAGSRAEFHDLLGKARAVLELPGDRIRAESAYEAAAETVLSQSDIVVAVWDGGPSGGHGGTTETIELAAQTALPIVIVDANGSSEPRLYWAGLSKDALAGGHLRDLPGIGLAAGIPELVDRLIRPPRSSTPGTLHQEDEAAGLARFLAEDAPATNFYFAFPVLMALFRVRKLSAGDVRLRPPDALAAEQAELAPPAPDAHPAAQPTLLAAAYGWADFVGALLAQIFRGAFVLNFTFAALAVACAAVSIVQHGWKPWLVVVELLLIVIVLVNTGLGWRREWHRRWFEGRELAERLRVAQLLWTVGLRPDDASGSERTWTGWYARAMVRAQGLRHALLDGEGLTATRNAAANLLDGQCRYHAIAAGRMHRLERRLETAGFICLIVTIAVAAFYLGFTAFNMLTGSHDEAVELGLVVAALTAGLPALATATYGIRVIGDFAGISRRSHRTHDAVEAIVARLRARQPNLRTMSAEIRAAADMMLGDVAGWRLSAESRGLAIPG